MRAFLAIPIDDAVRDRIVETQKALQRADAGVRWVARENLHLTLKFLGDVAEPEISRLSERLGLEAQRFPSMDLDLSGVGRFPPGGPPRVVWVGCRGDVSRLVGLAQAVERVATELGFPSEERRFTPHLTIGRVKSPKNQERLLNALAARHDDVFGRARAEHFTLFRSTLTPDGPIYEQVVRFPLGVA
ncbi:MAG: RNA 2',3'-cyclic phosphodiesterase [Planctomycetes bacterium]|nr:RNA 2',3'-cyclic phosphodiesterase [Planctomycetota bacterium]